MLTDLEKHTFVNKVIREGGWDYALRCYGYPYYLCDKDPKFASLVNRYKDGDNSVLEELKAYVHTGKSINEFDEKSYDEQYWLNWSSAAHDERRRSLT